jgi:hypothetical protein
MDANATAAYSTFKGLDKMSYVRCSVAVLGELHA